MERVGTLFGFVCLTGGVLLSALSYAGVFAHFMMAKNQFQHDGDNFDFVPILLLLFVSLAILGLRKLVVNGQRGFAAIISIVALTLAVVPRFLWPFPMNVILLSPVFFACLGGALLGFGSVSNRSIDEIKPKARVY
jgi:hypothetical protein